MKVYIEKNSINTEKFLIACLSFGSYQKLFVWVLLGFFHKLLCLLSNFHIIHIIIHTFDMHGFYLRLLFPHTWIASLVLRLDWHIFSPFPLVFYIYNQLSNTINDIFLSCLKCQINLWLIIINWNYLLRNNWDVLSHIVHVWLWSIWKFTLIVAFPTTWKKYRQQ